MNGRIKMSKLYALITSDKVYPAVPGNRETLN